MRPKEEILKDTIKGTSATPDWDTTASLHERLTIELLIDIRDELTALKQVISTYSEWERQVP